eukprot:scaffold4328_cov135-Isochrysis_galbana.AAC.8
MRSFIAGVAPGIPPTADRPSVASPPDSTPMAGAPEKKAPAGESRRSLERPLQHVPHRGRQVHLVGAAHQEGPTKRHEGVDLHRSPWGGGKEAEDHTRKVDATLHHHSNAVRVCKRQPTPTAALPPPAFWRGPRTPTQGPGPM